MALPTFRPLRLGRPTLTTKVSATEVTDAQTWLFAVVDDDSNVVVSAAGQTSTGTKYIYAGFLPTPLDSTTYGSVSWVDVSGSIWVTDLADIWHIFAHGYHWISYSNGAADSLSVVGLNPADLSVAFGPYLIVDSGGGGLVPWNTNMKTNDHFLVVGPWHSVCVGFSDRDNNETYIEVVDTGGVEIARYQFSNLSAPALPANSGCSAQRVTRTSTLKIERRFRMMVTTTLSPSSDSDILLYDFDRTWTASSVTPVTLLSTAGVNYGMATEQNLSALGHRLVTYRKFPTGGAGGVAGDMGQLARTWFDSAGVAASSEEVLVSGLETARPHTQPWTDPTTSKSYLLTCWSAQPAVKYIGYLQVEEIG